LPSTRNMTLRESGQTSVWSFITRIPEQPIEEAKQMTAKTAVQAEMVAGAASHDGLDWHAIELIVGIWQKHEVIEEFAYAARIPFGWGSTGC
jgi:hypothetical protein